MFNGHLDTVSICDGWTKDPFIPFIDDKPIYPIPEGYTKYVAEEEPIAEEKAVTPTTTQVTTGDDSGVMTETTKVATDFAKQTPEKVPFPPSVPLKCKKVIKRSLLHLRTPKVEKTS